MIPGIVAEIVRQLGPGHREAIYRNALAHLLQQRGYRVTAEQVVPIRLDDGFCAGFAYADLIIGDNDAVIELKVTANAAVSAAAQAQLAKYKTQLDTAAAFLVVFSNTSADYNVHPL